MRQINLELFIVLFVFAVLSTVYCEPIGLNYPGFNYLGPGNPVNNGQPVNSADTIAREHDIAYENSKTYDDVIKADERAITKFYVDLWTPGNIVNKIGARAGFWNLGIKNVAERVIGRTIYPWNKPKA
ncbi:uncharacterized protein LOC123290580 [Chrysoperla carnea]|uniref:uncharacterized protein LOC123290580 n=1 Tax=Chrysoperla carnea TaxID=189513 RepID=UPI001D0864CD|nr:uncharacterized protein LOC123290580 [Chrysoperla carnea]